MRDSEGLLKWIRRYAHLRPNDRYLLIHEKYTDIQKEIPDWTHYGESELRAALQWRKKHFTSLSNEVKRLTVGQIKTTKTASEELRILSQQDPDIVSECFSQETECLSLIEDIHKAEIYREINAKLANQWVETTQHSSDHFFNVMVRALRDELRDQSRPVLANEFADFQLPYMMLRQCLKRFLEVVCVRNKSDEAVVPDLLDKLPAMIKLRSQAPLPNEALEPLMAFRGDVRWSFDNRRRLAQKTHDVKNLLQMIQDDQTDLENLCSRLPETYPSDQLHENHPFRNHFGFTTASPSGYVGWIKQGKPKRKLEEELELYRYPTLQRIAHSLPRSPKYRSNVARVITILERSRGWSFENKIKAINSLKEVWNNMAPSEHYTKILEKALPVIRRRGMVKFTRNRAEAYSSGLKYIRSLTTRKPLAARRKKK